jgi:hypothetical protein
LGIVQAERSTVRTSWLGCPAFVPAAAMTLLLGNALDLLGTRAAQPNFENEANVVYQALKSHGIAVGWPAVITAKLAVTVLFVLGLCLFLRLRRRYYPPDGCGFREFITTFLYQRPLGWVETLYRLPRNIRPSLLFAAAGAALSGPYYAYLGYENIAVDRGWWVAPSFHIGPVWVDGFVIPYTLAVAAWLSYQLWLDYRDVSLNSRQSNTD